MSFPRYPAYKDSGVEWLGAVPEHWGLPKLKHIARFSGGGTPSRDNLEFWGGDIPWVSPKDMKVELVQDAEEYVTSIGLENSTTNLIPPGRVLMVVRSGILKHTIPVAINTVEVTLNQDMKALDFGVGRCDSRFFLRWVQGLNDVLLLEWAKQGATVESIEQEYLANSVIPLPSLIEQATIANFLDRETAKIDALAAEYRTLIELLKEKRQAVISRAVTKGLDPTVPMKDSGVQWLGKVPEHWEVCALRWRASCASGTGLSADLVEDECDEQRSIPVIGGNGRMGFTHEPNIEETVLSVGRVGALCGNVHTVLPRSWITDNALVLRPNGAYLRIPYLAAALTTRNLNEIASKTAQPLITGTQVLDQRVPVPALAEQEAIVSFVQRETMKLDALVSEADRAISLLQERRTALISAAVTGKIDVRGLAARDPMAG